MRKLGKKASSQNGTMTAFACDCMSICASYANCTQYCTSGTAFESGYYTSYGKLVANSLSGSNFLWGK